jgi:hypothetical protein
VDETILYAVQLVYVLHYCLTLILLRVLDKCVIANVDTNTNELSTTKDAGESRVLMSTPAFATDDGA